MDKKLLGMLGGASALALVSGGPSSAATSQMEPPALQPAQSFGELLDPIPNALDVLAAEDEKPATVAPQIQLVQWHHHHHHHHHMFYHHHHHHHHMFYHHHHHHHHHHWWRRRWMYY